jgi:hypothetical protein
MMQQGEFMIAKTSAKLIMLFKAALIAALLTLSINTCLAARVSVGISAGGGYHDGGYYDGGYYEETDYVSDARWVPGHWRHGYWIPGQYVEYAPAPVYYAPVANDVVWYGDDYGYGRGYRHGGHGGYGGYYGHHRH